jgi:NADH-quinone oxidoreductase subunit N
MGTFDVTEISDVSFCRIAGLVSNWNYFINNRNVFQNSGCTISFWAPDVYEGSPVLTTALMSTFQSCSYRYLV